MRRILRQLVEETGDNELSEHFGLAENLHINFYEARLPAEDVELYLGHVERLVGKLGDAAQDELGPVHIEVSRS